MEPVEPCTPALQLGGSVEERQLSYLRASFASLGSRDDVEFFLPDGDTTVSGVSQAAGGEGLQDL